LKGLKVIGILQDLLFRPQLFAQYTIKERPTPSSFWWNQ